MSKIILKAKNAKKSYKLGKVDINVLKGVDFEVEQGTWTALLGASGSGKTTLLNLLSTFEKADSGDIFYKQTPYSTMKKKEFVTFRREHVGFIFQAYHLLPELTVLENVELPARFTKAKRDDVRKRAKDLLEKVGLSHRIKHRPNELSGGEQQRAAIARALINKPDMILADEPTGNLDSNTGAGILDIFKQLHSGDDPVTIIMVTHDRDVASLADHIIELKDGCVS